METPSRSIACCFSGYRPEKMPLPLPGGPAVPKALNGPLCDAVRTAYRDGYTHFLSGMSRGFDLWAAQTVLLLRRELPLQLLCIQPFTAQSAGWDAPWRAAYEMVCAQADAVFTLSPHYYAGCYQARNRFLADASSRLICYYDGHAGGTKYTVRYAAAAGLFIENLAVPQLSFADLPSAPAKTRRTAPHL